MGNCCESCFGGGSSEYEEIPGQENASLLEKTSTKADEGEMEFRTINSEKQIEQDAMEFDNNSSVFEGLELLQKFTNKSSYDTRFIWINLHSRTIHMSQYMTKDRRHKEAGLTDVTSVVAGPPAKFKRGSTVDGPSTEGLSTNCLTINFQRGGGIDLCFKTETDRNLWFTTLKKIILQNSTVPVEGAASQ